MENPTFYLEAKYNYELVHRKNMCNSLIPPHIHDSAEIYLNLSSLPNILLGNRVMTAAPGTLIIIPPFCVHRLFDRTDEIYDRYILSINLSWLDSVLVNGNVEYEYLKNPEMPLLLPLSPSEPGRLQQSFEELLSLNESDTFHKLSGFFRCMSIINNTVKQNHTDNDKTIKSSATQQMVSDIIRYLNEHTDRNVTLQELSGHFYLNPDYISRIFKKHTNSTVGNYITLQKMARAKQLLLKGYTITQVQIMTGYSSYAHFSRTFRKQTGMTPGAYRGESLK